MEQEARKLAKEIFALIHDKAYCTEEDIYNFLMDCDSPMTETVQELADLYLECLKEEEAMDMEMNSNYYRDVMPRR